MTLIDIVWPWGALSAARRVVSAQRDLIEAQSGKCRVLQENVEDAERRGNENRLRVINAEAEIVRLKTIIRDGHFRNPDTGRLGAKGQLFPRKAKP